MILIDLNQVVLSNLMVSLRDEKDVNEDLLRHMVLNTLRSLVVQFKRKYGEIVVCCDSRRYWRKDYFPFYKSNRKKDRDASKLDWKLIFETMDKLRAELKEFFPYKVIEVDLAEADDIIAVLAGRFSSNEEVLILSSDKDFMQLQKYKNVIQYSPIMKKFLKTDTPHAFLKEQIMRGDRGDGVPNFMSPDNTFALGARQKRLNNTKMADWIKHDPEDFCNDMMLRGFKRNQMLIDLDYIPETLKEKIVAEYEACETKGKMSRMKLLNYFIAKGLKELISKLDEF